MSKGKETSQSRNILLILSLIIVGVFLSTSILYIVSWIVSGDISISSAALDFQVKVVSFTVETIRLYQIIKSI